MKHLRDRTAIVTGASRGIGAAIAQALAQEGVHVVLAARSADRIEQLADDLQRTYAVRALAVPTDMSDPAQVAALVQTAERVLGGVDILVNNAGLGIYGDVVTVDLADLRYVFDVNFFGVVVAMQAVVPSMRARGGGTIVNVSSIVGKIPQPQGGGYSATKYALQAISGAARAELKRNHIDVVVVCPGLTDTEFAAHSRISVPDAEGVTGERTAPLPGVPPQKVATRTIQAIRRGEREVYISFLDRLIVTAALAFPGPLAWGLVLMTWIRRRRFEQMQRGKPLVTAQELAVPVGWVAGGLGAAAFLWRWLRRRRDRG